VEHNFVRLGVVPYHRQGRPDGWWGV